MSYRKIGFKAELTSISLDRSKANDGKQKDYDKIPLGWVLSSTSRQKMDEQMPSILAQYDKIFK